MNKFYFVFLIGFFLFFGSVAFAQVFDVNNPSVVQSLTAKVLVSGSGEITGNLGSQQAVLKVLTFKETPHQKIKNLDEFLSINGKSYAATHETDSFGNNYAVFNIPETGKFNYSIEAFVETNSFLETLTDFDLSSSFSENSEFVLPSKFVESNDAKVRTIALNKFLSNSWLETVADTSDWVHNYVTYDWNYYPQTYSTIQVLDFKRGTCDEYATLAAGMLRAKNIPTRFVVGVSFSGKQWANHSWLEAFNPNSGWIQLDPTYGEVGLVDGTHISMGVFADPSEASDLITLPSTANVSILKNNPVVEIVSEKNFSNIVSLNAENIETSVLNETELIATIKNNLNSYGIYPLDLFLHPDFDSNSSTNLVILMKPLEEKTIVWGIKNLNAEIKNPNYIEYEFKLVSLSEKKTGKITVFPAKDGKIQFDVLIEDILPIVEGRDLKIDIFAENNGIETASIDVNLSGEQFIQKQFEIPALSKKTISLYIRNFKNSQYFLEIQTPTTRYERQIIPTASVPQENQINAIDKNVEENVLAESVGKESLKFLTIENFIFAGIIVAMFAIVLLLKDLFLKK